MVLSAPLLIWERPLDLAVLVSLVGAGAVIGLRSAGVADVPLLGDGLENHIIKGTAMASLGLLSIYFVKGD